MALDNADSTHPQIEDLKHNRWLGVVAEEESVDRENSSLFNSLMAVIAATLNTDTLENPELKLLEKLTSAAVDAFDTAYQSVITEEIKRFAALKKGRTQMRTLLNALYSHSLGDGYYIKLSVLCFTVHALLDIEKGDFVRAWESVWEARNRVMHVIYAQLLNDTRERALQSKLHQYQERQQIKKETQPRRKKTTTKKAQEEVYEQDLQKQIVVKLSGGPKRARFEPGKSKHDVMAELQKFNQTHHNLPLLFVKSPVAAVTHIVIPNHVDAPSATSSKSGKGHAEVMHLSRFIKFLETLQ